MKILITGANGFLGQHLTLYLAGKAYEVAACSRGVSRIPEKYAFRYFPTDLTREDDIAAVVREAAPDVIVHAAAMSKPDECNNNREMCLKNNVEATRFLLEASRPLRPHFIYVSTDFIFGENGPHGEEDIPGPLNFYGESKLRAENIVAQSGLKYAIVRPVFIYGPLLPQMRPSFLHWVKNNLEEGKQIRVVSDQQRTPTFVTDICKGIETIAQEGQEGIFHLAGRDILSPYEMAVAVADFFNLDAALIQNVTSDTFAEPVRRARKSGLKIDKAVKILDYRPVSFLEGMHLTFNTSKYADAP